jgi:ABC-type Fe3+/spermidine/putrescine transport system ATPase subunit
LGTIENTVPTTDSKLFEEFHLLDRNETFNDFSDGLDKLVALLGVATDKANYPMMAIIGAGGSGKSTWLLSLKGQKDKVVELLNDKIEKVRHEKKMDIPRVKNAVFLYARFSDSTTYKKNEDIIQGTCARMALWYARKMQDNAHVDSLISSPECASFRTFVQWVRNKEEQQTAGKDGQIAVFLLIDDILNITNPEERRRLLDELNGFQQGQLGQRLATFFVVSTSRLAPIRDVERQLIVLRVSPLSHTTQTNVVKHIFEERHVTKNPNPEEDPSYHHAVEVAVAQTGGHPRSLARVYEHALDTVKMPEFSTNGTPVITTTEQLTAALELLRGLVSGEVRGSLVESQTVCFRKEVGSPVSEMIGNQFVSIRPYDRTCQALSITIHPSCFSRLTLSHFKGSPLYRMACLLQKIGSGHQMCWRMNSLKQWAHTLVCVEELRACLLFPSSAGKETPHAAILPHSCVVYWKGHTNLQINKDVVENLSAESHCEVASIEKPLQDHVLVTIHNGAAESHISGYQNLYQGVSNQESAPQNVPVFFGVKMYKTVTSEQVKQWIDDMHQHIQKSLELQPAQYYVKLFCGASNLKELTELDNLQQGTILVPLESIKAMMEPFGTTSFENYFDPKCT